MNRIHEKTVKSDIPPSKFKFPRHPLTMDNPRSVMFERMATVKDRIAEFEETLNARREKNSR